MSSKPQRYTAPANGGFTLVEIMIVVAIIGLLAALAVPTFHRIQRNAQNTRVANDFRIFAQSFEKFAAENGDWPPNATSGVVPTGMSGDFRGNTWQLTTTIGGRWNWDRNMSGVAAGIAISSFTVTDAQLAEIDALIDDGDISTGSVRKMTTNKFTYILEQ